MPTPYQRLVEIIDDEDDDPKRDNSDLAALVAERLSELTDGWDVVQPAIAKFISDLRRAELRRDERHIRSYRPGDGTQPARNPMGQLALEQLREMVGEMIAIPSAGRIAAERVTVKQWTLKIDDLRGHANATLRTADWYGSIVTTLKAMRVNTIGAALKKAEEGKEAA